MGSVRPGGCHFTHWLPPLPMVFLRKLPHSCPIYLKSFSVGLVDLSQPWVTWESHWSPPLGVVFYKNNHVSRIDIQEICHNHHSLTPPSKGDRSWWVSRWLAWTRCLPATCAKNSWYGQARVSDHMLIDQWWASLWSAGSQGVTADSLGMHVASQELGEVGNKTITTQTLVHLLPLVVMVWRV